MKNRNLYLNFPNFFNFLVVKVEEAVGCPKLPKM